MLGFPIHFFNISFGNYAPSGWIFTWNLNARYTLSGCRNTFTVFLCKLAADIHGGGVSKHMVTYKPVALMFTIAGLVLVAPVTQNIVIRIQELEGQLNAGFVHPLYWTFILWLYNFGFFCDRYQLCFAVLFKLSYGWAKTKVHPYTHAYPFLIQTHAH